MYVETIKARCPSPLPLGGAEKDILFHTVEFKID